MVWQRTSGCTNISQQTLEIFDRQTMDSLASSYDWSSFLKTVSYSDVYHKFVALHDSFKSKARRNIVVKKRMPDCVWLSADILSASRRKISYGRVVGDHLQVFNCVESFVQPETRLMPLFALLKGSTSKKNFRKIVLISREPGPLQTVFEGASVSAPLMTS